MTLDEAIRHCHEVAENAHNNAYSGSLDFGNYLKCELKHLQLERWLRQLKGYRKAHEMIKNLPNANPSYWHSCDVIDRADCLAIIDECIEVIE